MVPLLSHRRIEAPFTMVTNGTIWIRLLSLAVSLPHVPLSNIDSAVAPHALSLSMILTLFPEASVDTAISKLIRPASYKSLNPFSSRRPNCFP